MKGFKQELENANNLNVVCTVEFICALSNCTSMKWNWLGNQNRTTENEARKAMIVVLRNTAAFLVFSAESSSPLLKLVTLFLDFLTLFMIWMYAITVIVPGMTIIPENLNTAWKILKACPAAWKSSQKQTKELEPSFVFLFFTLTTVPTSMAKARSHGSRTRAATRKRDRAKFL